MRTPPVVYLFVISSLSTLPTVARAETAMTAGRSEAAGNNMLWNGTFDGAALRPWNVGLASSRSGHAEIANHELCVEIDEPGQSASSIAVRQRPLAIGHGHHYQLRFRAHATHPTRVRARLTKINAPYTELWAATADATPEARDYAATFEAAVDEENVELAIDLGGPLAGSAPLSVCLDDLELNDPQAEIPIERAHPRVVSKVRVNQVGYLPGMPKIATVVTGNMGTVGFDGQHPVGGRSIG